MIARQTAEIVHDLKTLTQRVMTDAHIIHWAFDDAGRAFADRISKNKTVLYAVGKTYAVTPKRGSLSAWVKWNTDHPSAICYPKQRSDVEGLAKLGYVQLRIKVTSIEIGKLHDMTDEQVIAEGVADRAAYIALWNSINGAGAWGVNPTVARIAFLPVKTFVTDAALTASPLAQRLARQPERRMR